MSHDPYRKFNLIKGLVDEEIVYRGDIIYPYSGKIKIKLQSSTADQITLEKGQSLRVPFTRIYVSTPTEPGTLILGFGWEVESHNIIQPASSTVVCSNVVCTLANTEYSITLSSQTRKFIIKSRDGTAFRIAFAPDQVVAGIYFTVPQACIYFEDLLELSGMKIYFSFPADAGKIIEAIHWV